MLRVAGGPSPTRVLLFGVLAALSATTLGAAEPPSFVRDLDLIYHRQGGYALTMDRVAPVAEANGAAVLMLVSGGWVSRHAFLEPRVGDQLPRVLARAVLNPTELLARGYTLFLVVHGAQPKFTIAEIHGQIGEAVRHVRHNAEGYGVDPSRIGVMGGSAGGHLALLQGTRGLRGSDDPGTQAERSSRVQAVVAYFPPTDFLNFGAEGVFVDDAIRRVEADGGNPFLQALYLFDHDPQKMRITRVTDEQRLAQHYRDISPYYHVTADDPPTLLVHGDADERVPIQQSERILERFEVEGVEHRLYTKAGAGHGWQPTPEERAVVADWFDRHLPDVP